MRIAAPTRPVLRYHGGKWKDGRWIISHFPAHRIYVECFGGGGSVLIQKKRSYAEVYNDKWDTVVNVFEILRDPSLSKELERRLRQTPYSRTEFNKCGDIDISLIQDPIEKARLTIFRSFAGFGSASTNAKYSTGFRANSNRSGTTPAHDWANYPDQIKRFVERLQGVVIENKDYQSIINQQDTAETLFFLDPPYVWDTRNMQSGNAAYAHEMTDQDHIDMAERVNQIKGMCIISGYESDLYNELFRGWKLVKKKSFADGAAARIECLWINKKAQMSSGLLFTG